MNLENLKMLELAVELLDSLRDEVVFVGGATVELWITDEAAPEFRPTADIDVVVEIASQREYYQLENRIREIGFENEQGSGVICRFAHPGTELILDVMPTDASILGFENRWQAEAFSEAVEVALPGGQKLQAIPPPFLLATKLEAFATRGNLDFFGSRDFGATSPSVWSSFLIIGTRSRARGRAPFQPRVSRSSGHRHLAEDPAADGRMRA